MATLSVRVPPELIELIDRLVAEGVYPNRTAAVRAALDGLARDERRRALDQAIAEGYRRFPPDPPGDLERSLAEQSVRQESW